MDKILTFDFYGILIDTKPISDTISNIAKGYWWDIVPCSKLGWRKIWVNRNYKKGSRRHKTYKEVINLI